MQARAIFEAAVEAGKRTGEPVVPEVMVPLIATQARVRHRQGAHRRDGGGGDRRRRAAKSGLSGRHDDRAAARSADAPAKSRETAEFFSFGTNDLTQTTFGISRDDAASFLGAYTARGILAVDPFMSIDQQGVGELVRIAVERGRKTRQEPEDRHLRRTRRRPSFGRLLSRSRAGLRVLLAVPGTDRAAGGGTGGAWQVGNQHGIASAAGG